MRPQLVPWGPKTSSFLLVRPDLYVSIGILFPILQSLTPMHNFVSNLPHYLGVSVHTPLLTLHILQNTYLWSLIFGDVYVDITSHCLSHKNLNIDSALYTYLLPGPEGPGFMWLFFLKVLWARPLHCAPAVELVGKIRTYRRVPTKRVHTNFAARNTHRYQLQQPCLNRIQVTPSF